jgi:hypothetical protein
MSFAHAGYYTIERIAPERVDGYGETRTIICRTDANPTASAWFDATHAAAHAVSNSGNEGSKAPTAKRPVESRTG